MHAHIFTNRHAYVHTELIFCVEEFMYSKSSSCLDHKNVDNGNFGIVYLGLTEAGFTNFSLCDAVHFIYEAGFAFL